MLSHLKCFSVSLFFAIFLFHSMVSAKDVVVVWPVVGEGVAVGEFTGLIADGLSSQYQIAEVAAVASAVKNNRCEHKGNFCSTDIAFSFDSELIVSTEVSKDARGYHVSLAVDNIVTGDKLYVVEKSCKPCSEQQFKSFLPTILAGFIVKARPVSAPITASASVTAPKANSLAVNQTAVNSTIKTVVPVKQNKSEILPIIKIAPMYPRRAQSRGVEGYCVVAYTVTMTGSVKDPKPVDCVPAGHFERASVKAALKFKYRPSVINGQAVEMTAVKNRFDFKLAR